VSTPVQLIATDFDGTIFAEPDQPPIPPRLLELLARFQARGGKWVINTGRDLAGLQAALARANASVQPDYLVLIEREIYCRRDGHYEGLASWNDASRRAHEELFARVGPEVPRLTAWVGARFRATLYADAYSPFCVLAASNSEADAIQDLLEQFCRTIPNLAFVRNDVYGRFGHADFNKGSALGEISRQLGLPPAAVFAVGDHWNDLPMLNPRRAGYLAAPANAIEPVKAALRRHGGYISARPHGHGVVEALERCLPQPL